VTPGRFWVPKGFTTNVILVMGDKEAAAMRARPYRAPWDATLRGLVKV